MNGDKFQNTSAILDGEQSPGADQPKPEEAGPDIEYIEAVIQLAKKHNVDLVVGDIEVGQLAGKAGK